MQSRTAPPTPLPMTWPARLMEAELAVTRPSSRSPSNAETATSSLHVPGPLFVPRPGKRRLGERLPPPQPWLRYWWNRSCKNDGVARRTLCRATADGEFPAAISPARSAVDIRSRDGLRRPLPVRVIAGSAAKPPSGWMQFPVRSWVH